MSEPGAHLILLRTKPVGRVSNLKSNSEVALYAGSGLEISLPFDPELETLWASQAQIESIFGIDQSGVSRHLKKIFSDQEVDPKSNMQKMHIANADRKVTFYSLDVILAVGYRVNSSRAIEFRKWANEIIKNYVLNGLAVNQNRLEELGKIVQVLARSMDELVAGSAEIISEYLPGLQMLRDYDNGQVTSAPSTTPGWQLTIEEARNVIASTAQNFPADAMFGRERGDALQGVVGAIYQGFAGNELYSTVEEKAANLLYLIVKDHPLTDGNKRSAAAMFVTFLARNGILNDHTGSPRFSNNALAALTLMVAMSEPKEKDLMVALIIRMITAAAKSSE